MKRVGLKIDHALVALEHIEPEEKTHVMVSVLVIGHDGESTIEE